MHTGNRTVSHYLFSEDVRSCHLQRQIRYACVTNTAQQTLAYVRHITASMLTH